MPSASVQGVGAGTPVEAPAGGHSRMGRGQGVARRGHRSAAAHMLGFSRPLSYIQGKRPRWGLAPPNSAPIRSAPPRQHMFAAFHGLAAYSYPGSVAGPRGTSTSRCDGAASRRRNLCTEGRGRCGSVRGVPVAPPEVGTGRARLLPPLVGPFHLKLSNGICCQHFSRSQSVCLTQTVPRALVNQRGVLAIGPPRPI